MEQILLTRANALVSFGSKPENTLAETANGGKEMPIATGDIATRIWRWGRNNNLPAEREAFVGDNNIVGELLSTKRNMILGEGLQCYREEYLEGERVLIPVPNPSSAQEFFENVDINTYLMHAARELVFHANIFVEFVRDFNNRIASFRVMKCRHMRPEEMDLQGRINNYFFSGRWKEYTKQRYTPIAIPAYTNEELPQRKFIIHYLDDMLSDDYLGIPMWWGGRAWIELANQIPVFHLNNLKNGYTLRWHIEVPKDYFADYTSVQQTEQGRKDAKSREEAAKQEFLKKLDEFLSGPEQSGRALITTYEINKQLGKEFPGIKVTPLNFDMKDSALLSLFEKSNDANISGSGIHPTLAAIQTQGKLSSGSEIRNAYNMYVAIKTPTARHLVLKAIHFVHKVNGWGENLVWGFRNTTLETLENSETGTEPAQPTA